MVGSSSNRSRGGIAGREAEQRDACSICVGKAVSWGLWESVLQQETTGESAERPDGGGQAGKMHFLSRDPLEG